MAEEQKIQYFDAKYLDPKFPIVKPDPSVDDVIKGMLDLFLIEARTGARNGHTYLKNLLSLLSTHYIHNYSNYDDLEQQRAAGAP